MSSHCVYRIDCSVSGKAYIGLTKIGAAKRFAAHRYNAARGAAGALYRATLARKREERERGAAG